MAQDVERDEAKAKLAKPVIFPVVEHFTSINGEGLRAGQLAAFVRMAGCNLDCAWCDTTWANEPGVAFEALSSDDLVRFVADAQVRCVTLTGGEPCLQPHLDELITALVASDEWGMSAAGTCLADAGEPLQATSASSRIIELETNGAVDLRRFDALRRDVERRAPVATTVAFTVDCKLASSGMHDRMVFENYDLLRAQDAVKFVVGSQEDLKQACQIIERHDLCSKAQVFLSPVFGSIDPADMVQFMVDHHLAQARLQLQLHKIVWPHVDKGV